MGLDAGIINSRKTVTPKPPMKWVALLQNNRLAGKDSTSASTVAPVVVNPETLSNHALLNVNGSPQSAYGNMPNMKDKSHEITMIRKPSLMVNCWEPRTKINGNAPDTAVIMKLISKGVAAPSPLNSDTNREKNMKSALTSSA